MVNEVEQAPFYGSSCRLHHLEMLQTLRVEDHVLHHVLRLGGIPFERARFQGLIENQRVFKECNGKAETLEGQVFLTFP